MLKKFILIPGLICAGFVLGSLYKNGGLLPKKEKRVYTQLSSAAAFRDVCETACKNPEVFARYKKEPFYTLFHENLTSKQGAGFALKAGTQQALLPFAQKCDTVGGARVFLYEDLGTFSPSTLRALHMIAEMEEAFGPLKGKNVVEIGAGSATLGALLIAGKKVASYTYIDIAEPLHLTKKTLKQLGISGIGFYTPEQEFSLNPDLVISDYTFSEASAPRQKRLFKQLIKKAPQGYLHCHAFSRQFRVQSWTQDLLLRKLGARHSDLVISNEGDGAFKALWGARQVQVESAD